ncbi:MAG: adenylate/guanylate cyclase domain-containing protein [Lewinellaceae bacterium]|nr:adenylate/guanylate cyclase domain-containing protein [Lewinellaceae bacterium]
MGLFLVIMVMASTVCYNLAYEVLGYPFAWWTTLTYCTATIAGLIWLLYSGNYFFFKHLQFTLLLLLPPAAQLIHGGYTAGSGFILVSFLAPIGALIFNEWRAARVYFALYIVFLLGCGAWEYFFPPGQQHPPEVQTLFFEVNMILTTAIVYYLMERSLLYQTELQSILIAENKKSDALISNLLPQETADEIKATGLARAKSYPAATVMFTDFVEFSAFARTLSAEKLVEQIDFYFGAFDEIVRRNGLEKIKTIGDSYMCAGGLPTPKNSHVHDVVKAALEIRQSVHRHRAEKLAQFGYPFDIRIGIHTGHVVAGVVGNSKIAYDIWGETVNIASLMEQLCEPGRISISEATFALVKNDFSCTFRGRFPSRHIGEVAIYYTEQ